MENGGDLPYVALEQSERVRVRQHETGDVVIHEIPQGVEVHQAPRVGGNLDDVEAAERHRCRVGAVCAVRNQHLGALATTGGVPGPHEEQPGQFPRCAGGRLQSRRMHPGDRTQKVLEADEQLHPALDLVSGLRRVCGGEPGQRRGGVAELRVVLHRAGAERIGAVVDRVVTRRQAGHVGDEIALGHLGQHRWCIGEVFGSHGTGEIDLRYVGGAEGPGPTTGHGQLEDRRLCSVTRHGSRRRPPAARAAQDLRGRGFGGRVTAHASAFSRAAENPSIWSRVRVSVTATSIVFPRSG